jgi:hypothetical protein
MLAADGRASGWENPACCFFCAVWVPRRGGGVARGGQLTDVRVARFNARICRIECVFFWSDLMPHFPYTRSADQGS